MRLHPRTLVTAGLGGAAVFAYAARVRPWLLNWGARDEEVARVWPGDAYCSASYGQATRAVTIQAPAKDVWAWITQIGQDRGGFYSHTFLENLAGCQMPSVDRIVPEWRLRRIGDLIRMAPPHRYGGKARMMVGWYESERAMVLIMPEDAERVAAGGQAEMGIWSFLLDPIDERTCRFVMRTRSGPHPLYGGRWPNLLFWEPAHFIMERRMMLRIKELAERRARES
jgi:hypothetical protein